MALLDIRIYPDPVLTSPADPVQDFDDALRRLVDDMAETMYAGEGVGLAAPQVGVSRRLLVMDISNPEADGGTSLTAFVNPEIVEARGRITWEEGCLSFPGLTVEIERAEWVRVRAQDAAGEVFETEAAGLPAVCLQHEIDHLDGTVILDKLSRLRRGRALTRWKRLQAEQEE